METGPVMFYHSEDTPIVEGELEVYDDVTSQLPLTGTTAFDEFENCRLTIRWQYDGTAPVSDWHVYTKKNDGGFFYLGRTANGAAREFHWDNPEFNAQYQFRVWGIYEVDGNWQYIVLSQPAPMGYNLMDGADIKLKNIANPDDLPSQTVIVTDDLYHGESIEEDFDKPLERALALKWNPGDVNLLNTHIYISTDGENYEMAGQTGASDIYYFRFDANETFSQIEKFSDGPQDGVTYWFRIFALLKEGGFIRMNTGPVLFHLE